MDSNHDFDSASPDLRSFFEGYNAFDAPRPDFGCEPFYAGLIPVFYTQAPVHCDWPPSPNEINISLENNTPLGSKPCTVPPNTQEEIAAYTHEPTSCFPEWSTMSAAWPIGTTSTGRASGQRQACHYRGCTSTPFHSTCDLKTHLKEHLHDQLSHCEDGYPQSCKWPGCPSKATFKSKKALQMHLENIHVNPLLCPEKDCLYRTPFRNNYDLKRHIRTIHYDEKEFQFQCPFPQCGSFPRTFVRKDKWLNHLRSGHDDSACPFNHCDAGTAGMETRLVEHIKNSHGNFECGLGACDQEAPSRFAKFELMKHLEFHHGIQHEDIDTAQNAANQTSDRTIRVKGLPRETVWRDCRLCLRRSGTQEREREKTEIIFLD